MELSRAYVLVPRDFKMHDFLDLQSKPLAVSRQEPSWVCRTFMQGGAQLPASYGQAELPFPEQVLLSQQINMPLLFLSGA